MTGSEPIPPAAWQTIVRHVPIVSVDLVVRHEGGIVLGKRTNEPAKGEWFVPGGTVLKNEQLEQAVHRIAMEELTCEVRITDRLGAFEHFYDTSDVPGVESKHYVANAFVVEPKTPPVAGDAQHTRLRTVQPPWPDLHPYVERYLDAL